MIHNSWGWVCFLFNFLCFLSFFIKNVLFLFNLLSIVDGFDYFGFSVILQSFLSFYTKGLAILLVLLLAHKLGLFSIDVFDVGWLWIKFSPWVSLSTGLRFLFSTNLFLLFTSLFGQSEHILDLFVKILEETPES